MRKKILLLSLCMLLGLLQGCASLFETEVFEISDYKEEIWEDGVLVSAGVSDYTGVVEAIHRLVLDYETEGVIAFRNYEGDIDADISKAIREVQSTPLGAYAIDYIFYKPSQIISYNEARVTIVYRRLYEQIESIVDTLNLEHVEEELRNLLSQGETYLVVHLQENSPDLESMRNLLSNVYYRTYTGVLCRPEVEITAYPENGEDRIFEFKLDYQMTDRDIASKQLELAAAQRNFYSKLEGDTKIQQLLYGVQQLQQTYTYSEIEESSDHPKEDTLEHTAYGVFVSHKANSEGVAMAVMALCNELEISCQVIEGKWKKSPHFWNIITLDGEEYFVDASLIGTLGIRAVFLKNDETMPAEYHWDNEEYPECRGLLTYEDVMFYTE